MTLPEAVGSFALLSERLEQVFREFLVAADDIPPVEEFAKHHEVLVALRGVRAKLKQLLPLAQHRRGTHLAFVLKYDPSRAIGIAQLDSGEMVLFAFTAYYPRRGGMSFPLRGTRVRVVFTEFEGHSAVLAVTEVE
jgi:hypothetical protein